MGLKPGYKQTEVGVIPEEWDLRELGDVFILKSGFAFSSDFFSDTGPIVLTPGNFQIRGGLYFEERNTKRYSGSYDSSMTFNRGDLLIVMTDLTPDCNLLGKPAFVTTDDIILHNQRIGKVVFKGKSADANYLYYVLLSRDYLDRIKGMATGSTVRHTSNKSIYGVPVRLPSLPEQRAIAGALGDVDALLGALEKLIAKKRDLKQAAMQQLLAGQKRLPGFSGEWELRALGDGIALVSGHHVLAQHCNGRGDGVPYLTGPADFPNGKIHHTKFTERPTTLCAPDDILVTVKGSGSGSLVVSDALYCISRQLMAIRVRDWNGRFIYYSLLQNASQIKAASAGLIPGLSRSDILEQPLPLPSTTDEQTAIAEVLSDMDAEIATLEQRLVKTRALKQGMMQELLTGKTRLV